MVDYDVTKIAMAPNPHWVSEHITDDMTNAEIEAALIAREQGNLDELMRSHLQNIYMRGATDVLRDLRVVVNETLDSNFAPNKIAFVGLGKMLNESIADTVDYLMEACPREDEDE